MHTFGGQGQWQAIANEHASHFDVVHNNARVGAVTWALTGEHNRMNALAALAAADHLGVPVQASIEALCAFGGVKRRMELRGTARGIKVYDDFAHHPTAIATTLQGLRKQLGSQRILAVIEPRSNTMKLGVMAARLPEALQEADLAFCFSGADGKHALGWNPNLILAPMGDRASAYDDLDKMIQAICSCAEPGDSVLIMSNGSFGGIHQKLLDRLQT